MDRYTHVNLGNALLLKSGLNPEFTDWAGVPDYDSNFLHRYKYHRFSVLDKIFQVGQEHGLRNDDKTAIALCIISHFWNDIFNAPIWCFGFPFAAYYVEIAKAEDYDIAELKKDMDALSFPDVADAAIKKYFEESNTLFEENLNGYSADELIYGLISLTANARIFFKEGGKAKALKFVSKFTNKTISEVDLADFFEFQNKYAEIIIDTAKQI